MLAAAWAIYASLSGSIFRPADRTQVSEARRAKEPETFRFRNDVDPKTAAEINAAVPETTEPLVSARPFAAYLQGTAPQTRLSALDCLTAAVYYEAGSETPTGQRAVAQVVLNRVRHPAYPNSVCGVVFQGSQRKPGCQFTFTCDGSLARRPSQAGWSRARGVAAAALAGLVEPSVGLATHYHTIWVVPYWSANLTKLRTVGAHIFYRWNGGAGTRAAFTNTYANSEIIPAPAAASLAGFFLSSMPADAASVPVGLGIQGSSETNGTPLPTSGLLPRGGELSGDRRAAAEPASSGLERSDYRLKPDAAEHRLIEDQGALRDLN